MIEGLKGSWEWLAFAAQLPAKPIYTGGFKGTFTVYSGRCIVVGGYVFNDGTTAGQSYLYDGLDATGMKTSDVQVPASAAVPLTLGNVGILHEIGVYQNTSGILVEAAYYIIPLEHLPHTPPGQ